MKYWHPYVLSLVVVAALPGSAVLAQKTAWPTDPALLARAREILAKTPVIDSHNDLPSEILERAGGSLDAIDVAKPQPQLQTDIPRMRAGMMGAQFWSAYVENDSIKTGAALRVALRQIDMARRLTDRYPGDFERALTASDIERIEKTGKIASLIGVEGGHAIENSLSALRMLYELGVRYMTLTHNTTLDWADAALDYPRHHGMTQFGDSVVLEMNRLGMFADISHVSADVMRDVLRVSKAPVIFSHSSARALVDHPRNVPDDVLRMLPKNGGVVMVNFCPCFTAPGIDKWGARVDSVTSALRAQGLSRNDLNARLDEWQKRNPAPKVTVGDIANHIDHIKQVAGIDHIGIGSDFDGISGDHPIGLDDVSTYPVLFAELLKRGYTEEELRKIAGLNLLRAMHEMEAVSVKLRAERGPSLGDVPVVRPRT
jgi:membrane dipeptidase